MPQARFRGLITNSSYASPCEVMFVNPKIYLPFGDGLYHPFKVTLGMVYRWVCHRWRFRTSLLHWFTQPFWLKAYMWFRRGCYAKHRGGHQPCQTACRHQTLSLVNPFQVEYGENWGSQVTSIMDGKKAEDCIVCNRIGLATLNDLNGLEQPAAFCWVLWGGMQVCSRLWFWKDRACHPIATAWQHIRAKQSRVSDQDRAFGSVFSIPPWMLIPTDYKKKAIARARTLLTWVLHALLTCPCTWRFSSLWLYITISFYFTLPFFDAFLSMISIVIYVSLPNPCMVSL